MQERQHLIDVEEQHSIENLSAESVQNREFEIGRNVICSPTSEEQVGKTITSFYVR